MRKEISPVWFLAASVGMIAVLFGLFTVLKEDKPPRPYLKILGASFIFNYRVSDVYLGFTAVPDKPIPVGSVLEVTFENPAGGGPFVSRRGIGLPDRRISIRSPSLRGVKAHQPYEIRLRLFQPGKPEPIWQHSFVVRSNIDDSVVPDAPLVVGPGYQSPD